MSLLELQRRMAEDVRRPLMPGHRMQRETKDGRSVEEIAEGYVKSNAALSSFERLEIYNRQYWFRVIGAVAEDYPALHAVLGAERFDALIKAYLMEYPSRSWTLRDLGAKLPAFLEAHPGLCGRRCRLAQDVANLEWAYVDAFDGKSLLPLTSEDLQTIGPKSKLSLQPHLCLLALAYPVDDLVLAIRKRTVANGIVSSAAIEQRASFRTPLPPMKRDEVYLAVHRYDDSVYYRRIAREEFLLLKALRGGASIAEALQSAYAGMSLSPEEQSARVQQCFAHASELGWLCLRRQDEHRG